MYEMLFEPTSFPLCICVFPLLTLVCPDVLLQTVLVCTSRRLSYHVQLPSTLIPRHSCQNFVPVCLRLLRERQSIRRIWKTLLTIIPLMLHWLKDQLSIFIFWNLIDSPKEFVPFYYLTSSSLLLHFTEHFMQFSFLFVNSVSSVWASSLPSGYGHPYPLPAYGGGVR